MPYVILHDMVIDLAEPYTHNMGMFMVEQDIAEGDESLYIDQISAYLVGGLEKKIISPLRVTMLSLAQIQGVQRKKMLK